MLEGQTIESGTLGPHAHLQIPIGLLSDLSACTSLHQILKAFSKWASFVIDADRSVVALANEPDFLTIRALDGRSEVPEGTKMPVANSLLGEVYTEKTGVICTNPQDIPYPDTQSLAKIGMKTLINAPLTAGGRCFGVLATALSHNDQDYTEKHAIISAMAGCLATQLLVVEQIQHLAVLAETDALTGAFNRRHFDHAAGRLWDDWLRKKQPFTLISIDLDNFKSINDTYGHDAGDAVLRAIAGRIKSCLRDGDTVMRMGGEEFCLLLQNLDAKSSIQLSERIRDRIKRDAISTGDIAIAATASFGVAIVSGEDENLHALSKRADRALYQAKWEGRDRVVLG